MHIFKHHMIPCQYLFIMNQLGKKKPLWNQRPYSFCMALFFPIWNMINRYSLYEKIGKLFPKIVVKLQFHMEDIIYDIIIK